MSLPVKYTHRVNVEDIYVDAEELIEALAELAGFTAFKVLDNNGFCEGYVIEANDKDLRKFLGQTMTDEELAIEAAEENGYEPYTGVDF